MEPFKVTQNLGYGICLNSCYCNVFKETHETFIKRGCLAKFQYRELDQNRSVLTLVTKKSEVFVPEILSYNLIEFKLFKYLNAIIDFDERLKFYKNVKQREFVLHLERNSNVSVGFSSGKQTKAVFLEMNENEGKIFITVELLDRPLKYSLPANMIHTIASLDLRQRNNRDRLKFWRRIPIFRSNFDYSTLAYWRCSDNVQNHNTSNVSRGKSVSKSVEPVKKNISQNSDKSYKPASNNEPINENRCGTRDDSALMVPSSSSTDILINSRVCLVCLIIVSEDDICLSCTNKMEKIHGENNSQTKIESNLSLNTSLSRETPINSLDEEYFTSKTVGRNVKLDEGHIETRVGSLINSKLCLVCLTIVSEDDICRSCTNKMEKIHGENNSQTKIESNLSLNTSLSRETPINSLDEEYFTSKTVARNVKLNEGHSETRVGSLINSRLCLVCLIIVSEDDICLSCTNKMKKIYGENNSQTKIVSNISLDKCLSSETRISPLEINYSYVTNEDHLSYNSNIAVIHNISASNCIICKKDFDISEGFFFDLCKHTICKICIKNQTALKKLAHINIMPCCDRPIELDEKKYFSDIQQCFDKNCSAYYLWEECGEERPNKFTCNKFEYENCLNCRKIHVNLTCEQYGKIFGERNSVDRETVEMLLTWIREGIAMLCPNCQALIEKDEGYDYVKCPFCNIEICWATHGPRWGPNGKGDTSGGCGCDFKVKKCVDNCNFCG